MHEPALARLRGYVPILGDARTANERRHRPERKLNILIRTPGHEIIAAFGRVIAVWIAPHQHNVRVATDCKRPLLLVDVK
jgi:hypothetical protein